MTMRLARHRSLRAERRTCSLARALQTPVNENVTVVYRDSDYVSGSQLCYVIQPRSVQRTAMNALILSLSPEVREAALDLKSVRRRIKEAGARAYEWMPAEANARQRLLCLSLEHGGNQERLNSGQAPPPKPGEGFLKLARTSRG
jgi:hypothetical protein